MAKKQSRRSVSMNRGIYDALATYCEANDIAMSQFTEEALRAKMAGHPTLAAVAAAVPEGRSAGDGLTVDTEAVDDDVREIGRCGDSGELWAKAFMRIIGNGVNAGIGEAAPMRLEEDTMMGWFANAIEFAITARDHRVHRNRAEELGLQVSLSLTPDSYSIRGVYDALNEAGVPASLDPLQETMATPVSRIEHLAKGGTISASEAVTGFAAWLSTRYTTLQIGARHEAGQLVALIARFCEANKLPEPRDDYHKHFVHPAPIASDDNERNLPTIAELDAILAPADPVVVYDEPGT